MRASSSRAVASFSKVENQTLVLMGAVSVRVHGKGNLGAEPRAEVIADLLRAVAGPECLGLRDGLRLQSYSSLHFTSKKVNSCMA